MLLAKPKSQIFTMLSSARRTFLAARSPCITCYWDTQYDHSCGDNLTGLQLFETSNISWNGNHNTEWPNSTSQKSRVLYMYTESSTYLVRTEVVKEMDIKTMVFWDVIRWSLMDRSSAYVFDEPEDGGSRLLSNNWHPITQPIKLQQ